MIPNTKAMLLARAATDAGRYYGRRLVGAPFLALADAAASREVICKAGEVRAVTPFYWEDHLPRIKGSRTTGPEEVIQDDLNKKIVHLPPVTLYSLKNATLLNGSLYANGHRTDLRSVSKQTLRHFDLSGSASEVERAALISTCAGSTWWGHWILDEVPMHMYVEKLAPPLAFNRTPHYDESAYLELLGLVTPKRLGVAVVRELLVLDEFAQNPLKTRRYQDIRQKLFQQAKDKTRSRNPVYIARGNTGSYRNLVNEPELIARLEAQGFTTLNMKNTSPQQLLDACLGADLVVSVEGSHLAPVLYMMQQYGNLVLLNPPHRVLTTLGDVGIFCGLSAGMFICTEAGGPSSAEEFFADPDEVLRFIDDSRKFGENSKARLDDLLAETERVGGNAPRFV